MIGTTCKVSAQSADDSYPSFEPFTASRMWPLMGEPQVSVPVGEAATEIDNFLDEIDNLLNEANIFDEQAPVGATEDPETLDPNLSTKERLLWLEIPVTFLQLQPLWHKDEWTEDEVNFARSSARLVAAVSPQSRFEFQQNHDLENRENLNRMVDWFRLQAKEPHRYGYMIHTFDDGPWLALDYDAGSDLTIIDKVAISDGFDLELCKTTTDQWCLRGVAHGEVTWTKVLSKVPSGDFGFLPSALTPLGPYGWKINMSFGEYTHVYLDAQNQLLFYFTSW